MSRELKNSYLFKIFSGLDCKVILLRDSNRRTVGLSFFQIFQKPVVLGLHSQALVSGGYKGAFYEKLPEASPVSGRANLC